MEEDIKRCSFCNLTKNEVKVLIESDINKGKCICNKCVENLKKVINELPNLVG